jgi:FkbM family methyltransferase
LFSSTVRVCGHTFLPRLIDSNSTVLDLGAFDGDFAHAVIEQFQCRVVSAEPVEKLVDRIKPHHLHRVLPVAVGGTNQTIQINVYGSRCASICGFTFLGEGAVAQSTEMITLREFRRRSAVDQVDLLKVDIEGAEIDMFGSSTDQELQSAKQITTEFHDFLYPDQAKAVTHIRERMSDIGFWVIPFSWDNTDVLFVNKSSGVSATEVAYLRNIVRFGKGIGRRLRRIAS